MKRMLMLVAALLAFGGAMATTPETFAKKFTVTVNANFTGTGASNVPTLLRLSAGAPNGFDYADVQNSGKDMLIQDADGNELPFEIDTWDPTGESLVWVRLPTFEQNAAITVYYGASGVDNEHGTSAWQDYVGVWHLNDIQATDTENSYGEYPNSTATAGINGNLAEKSIANETGKFGQSFRVNDVTKLKTGNYNYGGVWVPGTDALKLGSTFAISGWFKNAANGFYYDHIFYKRTASNNGSGTKGAFAIEVSAGNGTVFKIGARGSSSATTALTATPSPFEDWVYLTFVYEDAKCHVYANGALVGDTAVAAVTDNEGALVFGNRSDISTGGTGDAAWSGWIDEVRLQDATPSADWVAAEYAAMAQTDALTYGTVENVDATVPSLTSLTSAVAADGSVTIAAVFAKNLPATGTVKVEINGAEYAMTTADTAVPATYTATVNGLAANTTYTYTVHYTSTGGSALAVTSESAFYTGAITIAKTSDADEKTLSAGCFTITRSDAGAALTVGYSVAGTATAGSDYVALSGSVVIPAGATSVQLEVTPLFNSAKDVDTTVAVTLIAGNYTVTEAAQSAELTIVNSSANVFVQFVSTTGSDDNDGYSASTAKATIPAALTVLSSLVESGEKLTVYLCDGAYAFDSGATAAVTVDIPVTITSLSGDASKVTVSRTGTSTRIFQLSHAEAEISKLTLARGTAVEGGAAYLDSNGGKLVDCVVIGCTNTAWNADGAVYVKAGRVARCSFTRNSYSRNGSALYATGGVIENCLFYGNYGGTAGAVCLNGAAVLANCTVANNTGTYCSGVKMSNAAGTAVNCAIFGNTAPESTIGAVYSANGARFFACAADLAIAGGTGCIQGEALFQDAAQGNFRLTPASCCLDAGIDPSSYAEYETDLDGASRVVGQIDIGCYESAKTALDCSFTCTLASKIVPATAVFSAKVLGATAGVTGTWDFGDGTTAALDETLTVSHVYTDAGTYTVTLTVVSGNTATYVREAVVKVAPAVMYVLYQNENAKYPYDTTATAAATLADAVAAAADGVTIYVLPGESGVHYQTSYVTLDKGVRVLGATGKPEDVVFENTVLNADGHGLMILNHPQAFVANLTFKNGSLRANNSLGADIRIKANGGTVSNCVINSAQAQHFSSYAAGAHLVAGLVTHTRFTGTFTSCPAYNVDPTSSGVVVYLNGSSARLENCLFTNLVIAASTVGDGTSCGPIVGVNSGSMVNCTIASDTQCIGTTSTDSKFSKYNGGCAIYCSSSGWVKNCVVVDVKNADGVITPFAGTASRFLNCAGNTETAWGGTDCIAGAATDFFKDYAAGDFVPKANGPLVDKGVAIDGWSTLVDLAGKPRIEGNAIDIGCYEGRSAGLCILVR